jgi:hypothetical protein
LSNVCPRQQQGERGGREKKGKEGRRKREGEGKGEEGERKEERRKEMGYRLI